MSWVLVGIDVIDAWRESEPDLDIRACVLDWLMGFYSGPGFANGVPSLAQPGVFVAIVPGTSVMVSYYVAAGLDPPAIAIREIRS